MKNRLLALIVAGVATSASPEFALKNGTAAQESYTWDVPVKVKRVSKPKRRQNAGEPRTQRAPLLTLKRQLIRRADGNVEELIDPSKTFRKFEQVKLAITPNQSGYLYVIHHSKGTDGAIVDQPRLVFPDPAINGGKNSVSKDQRYVVPAWCPQLDVPGDCWWDLEPPDGTEFFTIIFTRDELTELPSNATDAVAWIEQKVIDDIVATSRPADIKRSDKVSIKSRRKTESDGVYVQNTNPNDNEEIVETVSVTHIYGGDQDEGARARSLFVKQRSDAMRLQVLMQGSPADPSREFKEGDEIRIGFQSNFDGHVYVLNVTPDGKKRLLFPCSRLGDNKIRAGVDTFLPPGGAIAFDAEKGTEILMVLMSREPIDYLEAALQACCAQSAVNCCENFACDLTESASIAAAELGGKISFDEPPGVAAAARPEGLDAGVRSRGIVLGQGRDKDKKSYYVAVQDEQGTRLGAGKVAVFYIRLKHV